MRICSLLIKLKQGLVPCNCTVNNNLLILSNIIAKRQFGVIVLYNNGYVKNLWFWAFGLDHFFHQLMWEQSRIVKKTNELFFFLFFSSVKGLEDHQCGSDEVSCCSGVSFVTTNIFNSFTKNSNGALLKCIFAHVLFIEMFLGYPTKLRQIPIIQHNSKPPMIL